MVKPGIVIAIKDKSKNRNVPIEIETSDNVKDDKPAGQKFTY